MAFFELNSDITIGNFKFSGVHEVRIRKSIHSYADSAFIKIPSICRVKKSGMASSNYETTGKLFTDGDPVIINLGYNGQMQEEFIGFVRRRNLNMPLEVECEGYVRQLRLNSIKNGYYSPTSAKKLLALMTGTDITVQVANDLPFTGVALNFDPTAEDLIKEIKRASNGILTLFFIKPTVLWCGLVYTAYRNGNDPFALGQVAIRLGYNCIKDNGLKERVVEGEPIVIHGVSVGANGDKVQTLSEKQTAKRKEKAYFNKIGDVGTIQSLINEKQFKVNYAGYEGYINAFLQPYCAPGWKVNIVDARYPERNGIYLIEGTDVTFGVNGARRKIEIGPKIGFIP